MGGPQHVELDLALLSEPGFDLTAAFNQFMIDDESPYWSARRDDEREAMRRFDAAAAFEQNMRSRESSSEHEATRGH